MTKQDVLDVLSTIELPGADADLVASGMVSRTSACDGYISVTLAGPAANLPPQQQQAVIRTVEAAIRAQAKARNTTILQLSIDIAGSATPASTSGPAAPSVTLPQAGKPSQPQASKAPQQQAPSLPGVKHVIAVGAGKGGVGKSTVAINLAVGLALRGHAVGLMDGDIYGPSAPTMLGLDSLQANLHGNMLQPFMVHGIKTMTIGKLVDSEKPLIWRGPMAHGAFKQLVEQTEWGQLDYLIIDLPPGTGDVALTMAQLLRLTGAVVVCTPQKVAQDDAIRALRMFQQLNIEVLGVVENMSTFIGDDGKEYDLFGRGGAQLMAQRTGVPFLGAIPITMALRANSDEGNPSANFQGNTPLARALDAVCRNIEGQVALAGFKAPSRTPSLTIS
ncbi:MAG: Mrp/NBP35 family ATP-binding protein [Phycisphaerales bacterium]|jgi:ATP-binding protein involved in chromosome partitioning|nr:Mrp/NBP35 family ATP-binding protein [Phycisphaerales bacterium]